MIHILRFNIINSKAKSGFKVGGGKNEWVWGCSLMI